MPIVRKLAILALGMLAVGCSDSGPAGPEENGVATLTVDAAEDWALVRLDGGQASAVTVGEPSTSEAWDLGFFATSVMLNGGAAGPAGVVGHCVCQNASATDAEITDLTADAELEAFEAVSSSQIPASDDAWTSDALAAAIDGWYSYNSSTHVVSAVPANVWKVRTASGQAYAKFHVTAVENAARDHAGEVTFEFAVQPAPGAPFEAVQTATVDLSTGPAHFDLETASVVDASDAWDLLFSGYDIRVNGGVSGSGSAGASLSDESFGAIADASDLSAGHYRGDAFGGVFDSHRWYRYNVEGNHQIWPTYDVYLIKRGDAVYKVQLTSYYGATGDSRQITFRYARLR